MSNTRVVPRRTAGVGSYLTRTATTACVFLHLFLYPPLLPSFSPLVKPLIHVEVDTPVHRAVPRHPPNPVPNPARWTRREAPQDLRTPRLPSCSPSHVRAPFSPVFEVVSSRLTRSFANFLATHPFLHLISPSAPFTSRRMFHREGIEKLVTSLYFKGDPYLQRCVFLSPSLPLFLSPLTPSPISQRRRLRRKVLPHRRPSARHGRREGEGARLLARAVLAPAEGLRPSHGRAGGGAEEEVVGELLRQSSVSSSKPSLTFFVFSPYIVLHRRTSCGCLSSSCSLSCASH